MSRRILLVAVVTLGCYSHLLVSSSVGFTYDDGRFVEKNDAVHDLSNIGKFFSDPTLVDPRAWSGIYRPLRTLDFAVDWAIAGDSPRWFHFRNLLYHLAAALLVMALMLRWGAGPNAATLGALLFAVHPVQVEAAGWITSRGDVMCVAFFLLALLCHQRSRGMDRYFLAAAGALLLALFSKEVAVMFLPAAALADYLFRDERRIRSTAARWPQYLVYALAAILYVALWKGLHASYDAAEWHVRIRWGGGILGTLLTMMRGFVYYFRLILLPVDMAIDWYLGEVGGLDPLTAVCAVIVLALIGYSIFRLFRGGGVLAFAVLWFFITIFPSSNLPAPIGIVTAERFLYLPMAGVAVAAGMLLGHIWSRGTAGRAATVTLLSCLAIVSFQRTYAWVSDESLWLTALDRFESPRGLEWRAETLRERGADLMLGASRLREKGDEEAAARAVARAEKLLGNAESNYDRSMELWGKLPAAEAAVSVARANRAMVFYEQGRYELALREAQEVLDFWPDQTQGNLARGMALYGLGDFRAAARAAEAALANDSREFTRRKAAAIYQGLAQWYAKPEQDNVAQSYRALLRSWELYPDRSENRGVYAARQELEGQFEAQVQPLLKAAAARPGDLQVYLNLAVLYAQFADYEASSALFDQLLARDEIQADPAALSQVLFYQASQYWESMDTVEAYDRAEATYRRVFELAPDFTGVEDAIERVRHKRQELEASFARDLKKAPPPPK